MRCMISSTRISGFFTSSICLARVSRGGGVYTQGALGVALIGRCQRRVLVMEEVKQGADAPLERAPSESSAPLDRSPLDRLAQAHVFDQTRGPGAELVSGAEPKAVHAMLDDFTLPATVEHHWRAAVLHGLDGRHSEVFHTLRI